ncbi:hypothetical protein NDU88_001550 [Pleurodeles waltl]|uniref:Uncharacterized protein n=1 Tax=Pleurodeles waltl TaxID=8319 RepID=A0AAV7NFG9_PLEWA|nr:hypothetical protein NDU88_001550 [Pleurodeles waltl]
MGCQDRRGTEGLHTPKRLGLSSDATREQRQPACCGDKGTRPRPTGTRAAQREGSKHWGSAPPLPEAPKNTRCPARRQQAPAKFSRICWGLARNLTIGDEGGPTTIGSATTHDRGAPSGKQKGRTAPQSFAYLQEKPTVCPGKRRIPAAGAAGSGVPRSTGCQDRRGTKGLHTPKRLGLSSDTTREQRQPACCGDKGTRPRPTGTRAAQREGSKHWGSAPPLPEALKSTRCPARRQQTPGKCPAPPGGSQEHALPSAKAASTREVPHPSRRTPILRRPPTGLP